MARNDLMIGRLYKLLKRSAAATCVLCAFAAPHSTANAAPISNASFGITGQVAPTAGSNLGNTDSLFIGNGGLVSVSAAGTGGLSGLITIGESGMLQSFPNPTLLAIPVISPISNFISLGSGSNAVSVNLISATILLPRLTNSLELSGVVEVNAFGFDPTAGTLYLSVFPVGELFDVTVTTSVVSQTEQPVPQPGSLALVGVGLLGLFALGRRRATSHGTA